MPQVSRDTCSGTASIWPLRRYTRRWNGKRGDDAAFRSGISAWLCHNRVANLVGCLLYAVQVARGIGIRAPFERRRLTKSLVVMGARRLHTTTSSIGTYEEEFHGGLAAPRPTCRSLRLAESSMTNIYTWWDRPRTVTGKPRRRARQVRLFMRAARRANVSQRRVVLLFSNVVEHAFGTRYWLVCVSPLHVHR